MPHSALARRPTLANRETHRGIGHAARVAAPRLLDVIPSFERHLRAEDKAARTIKSYTEAVRRLHDFCSANGMPLDVANITSEHIEAFLADQLARLRAASARARFASLRQFFAWLASRDERVIDRSPMEHLEPPKVPSVPVPVLSIEHLKALLRTAERDGGFYGRQDSAQPDRDQEHPRLGNDDTAVQPRYGRTNAGGRCSCWVRALAPGSRSRGTAPGGRPARCCGPICAGPPPRERENLGEKPTVGPVPRLLARPRRGLADRVGSAPNGTCHDDPAV